MSISKKGLLATVGVASLSLLATFVTTVAPANAAINCNKVIGTGYAHLKGKTVTMFTSILDPELSKYQKALASFTACTGIKVKMEGSNQFEALLPVRVRGGNAPGHRDHSSTWSSGSNGGDWQSRRGTCTDSCKCE